MVFYIERILSTFGYAAFYAFIFAESGLFFGFVFPGDSLLFTAGLLAQKGLLDIGLLVAGGIVSAFAGDQVGYWTGQKFGTRFFSKPGDPFRDPKHIERTRKFYEAHGRKTIILARFVPAVRTFAPIFAGTAQMDYPTFVAYNALGGILWVASFTLLGYYLGTVIPADYVSVAILAVIALSLVPVAWEYRKEHPDAIRNIIEKVKMKIGHRTEKR